MKRVETIRALACTASLNVLKCDPGMLNCSDSDPTGRFRRKAGNGVVEYWSVGVVSESHIRLGKPSALLEDSHSSTTSGMVRVAVSSGDPIPLTLTLSHGEREQSATGWVIREVRRADSALGCAERQRRILPLPEGE